MEQTPFAKLLQTTAETSLSYTPDPPYLRSSLTNPSLPPVLFFLASKHTLLFSPFKFPYPLHYPHSLAPTCPSTPPLSNYHEKHYSH